MTLTVPAGALPAGSQLTAQPLTNLAHGGIGKAYRLGPAGAVFDPPATLTFAVAAADFGAASAADLDLLSPGLGIAYQDEAGYWRWVKGATYDPVARTVSVKITHLSSWSLVSGLQLLPLSASVAVGKPLQLQLVTCYGSNEDKDGAPLASLVPDPLASLVGFECGGSDPLAPLTSVSEWNVNGVAGGSSTYGTVTASGSQAATYRAPSKKPTPDTVGVWARLGGAQTTWLRSEIKIVGEVSYRGTAKATMLLAGNKVWEITADVTFTKDEGMSTAQQLVLTTSEGTITQTSYTMPVGAGVCYGDPDHFTDTYPIYPGDGYLVLERGSNPLRYSGSASISLNTPVQPHDYQVCCSYRTPACQAETMKIGEQEHEWWSTGGADLTAQPDGTLAGSATVGANYEWSFSPME